MASRRISHLQVDMYLACTNKAPYVSSLRIVLPCSFILATLINLLWAAFRCRSLELIAEGAFRYRVGVSSEYECSCDKKLRRMLCEHSLGVAMVLGEVQEYLEYCVNERTRRTFFGAWGFPFRN
ncbi:unnamed protein product [Gongylonema pulchrum]|uniref:SWIM-type domain-containing protein n=1 Tax=Gongylonema pulchrum TaxID=637853 RepID=A0A183EME4_9BILA|nr:unnamed protein product [Gongylonema pulchrum]